MKLITSTAEILLVFSCICALFAEKIDEYAKTDGKVKHYILYFSASVSIISVIALVFAAFL